MRNHLKRLNWWHRSGVLGAVLIVALGFAPLLSRARTPAATISIVNNSARSIQHVYLSPTDRDDWGPDLLNNSPIAPGGSSALNSSCSAADIKVIAEDQDGCFLYKVITCGESTTWTITNEATRDCGG